MFRAGIVKGSLNLLDFSWFHYLFSILILGPWSGLNFMKADLSEAGHSSDVLSIWLGPGDVGERHAPRLADDLGPGGVTEVHIVRWLLYEHRTCSVCLAIDCNKKIYDYILVTSQRNERRDKLAWAQTSFRSNRRQRKCCIHSTGVFACDYFKGRRKLLSQFYMRT